MSATGGSAESRDEDIEALRASVAEVGRDLKLLSSHVAELAAAAGRIAGEAGTPEDAAPATRSGQTPRASRSRASNVTVTVRPLPELAMAAMAETSLRGLPGVNQVVSVERFEDWARFTLEVVDGTDLVSEIRVALPVAFRAVESDSGELSLNLKWAWGTDQ